MSRKSKISVGILLALSISLIAFSILFHSMEASDIKLTKIKGNDSAFDNMNVIHTTVFNRSSVDRNIYPDFKTMGISEPVLIKSTGNKLLKIKVDNNSGVDFIANEKIYRPIENTNVDIHFKDDNLYITVYNKYNSPSREYNITPHIKNIENVFNGNKYHRSWKFFNIDGKNYFLICYSKNNSTKITFELLKLDNGSNKSELVYSGDFALQSKYSGKMYIFAVKSKIFASIIYGNQNNDVVVLDTEKHSAGKFSILNKTEKISSSQGKLFTYFNKRDNILDIYMEENDRIVKKSYTLENEKLKFIKSYDTGMTFPATETYFYKNNRLINTDNNKKEEFLKSSKGAEAQVNIYTEEPFYSIKGSKLFIIKNIYANVNEFYGKNKDDYFFNSDIAKKNSFIIYIYDINNKKILYCGILSGTEISNTNEIEISNISK